MRPVLVALLVLLTATASALAQDAKMLRLKQISIFDNQGWGQPVVAYTMLVPSDWKVEGGVTWNQGWHCLYTEMVSNHLRVTSPDGRYGFELFPDYAANWYQDPMSIQMQQRQIAAGQQVCPLSQPFGASDFLTRLFVPGFRQGAQVQSVEQNPQTAQAYYQDMVSKLGPLLQQGNMQVSADAARMILRYQGSDEMVMATTSITTIRGMSATAAANGQMAYAMHYNSNASRVVGFRAPQGELQAMDRLYSAMLSSIHINPAWEGAVQRVILNIGQINLKGAQDRSRIWQNTMSEIGDMQMKSWENRQESQDRIAHMWSQTIREVDDYVDPSTNTKVELPSGYDNIWSSGDGEYLLSQTPGFDPNNDLHTGHNWSRMEITR